MGYTNTQLKSKVQVHTAYMLDQVIFKCSGTLPVLDPGSKASGGKHALYWIRSEASKGRHTVLDQVTAERRGPLPVLD